MNYDRLVVVNTKKKDGQTETSCTLPQLQAGKTLFTVKTVSVKNAEGKEIDASHAHGSSRVTFRAPEDQLPGITLDATYIDARSFKETTKDPDKRSDWQVRFLSFKMSDLLRNR